MNVWRKATVADLRDIIELSAEAAASTHKHLCRRQLVRYCAITLPSGIRDDIDYTHVLVSDCGRIKAVVTVRELELKWIATRYSLFREGLGRRSLEFAESLGASVLAVDANNQQARALYESNGWVHSCNNKHGQLMYFYDPSDLI